jgi:hypothetical protein
MEAKEYNTISIYRGRDLLHRKICSKNKFFIPDEDIIVKVDDEKILITRPSIDYRGRSHKPKLIASGWIIFSIVADIPLISNLPINLEESNEDQLVIYLIQKL